jgi:DNA-binding transcriptional ArsR family regulator
MSSQLTIAPTSSQLAPVFAAFSDRTRLELLLRLLDDGPQTVGELVDATGIRQPSVSKHLACLHGCGVLERQRRGRTVLYGVGSEATGELISAAGRLWDAAACGESCPCPVCREGG